jgi:multimeric flavodoxin WrbA
MLTLPLVIIGSARKNGDTHQLVNSLFKETDTLDLLDYRIYPYSYTGAYPADDQFEEVVQVMLCHKALVFATPVYWYTMSSLMKTLFDRLTDIVTIHKQAGRQMAGKETYLIAAGSEQVLPDGFEAPFKLTSKYFKMNYKGSYYCKTKDLDTLPQKDAFLEKLFHHKK